MDCALTVVDDTEASRRLLLRAGLLANGVAAKLVVLNVVDADEYEGEVQRKANQGVKAEDFDDVTDAAKRTAENVASSALADIDVDYEAVGLVGDLPEDILTEAEDHDCDHIFIVGRRRSPTGKVIFGDVAQSVILNFEGPVTVLIDEE
ncbi:universal stress protein [Halostagnicola sp. GCM10023398]|uniref:universal stress protein n=1 Tax=unclassified Halostagnicola TaxID=2642439 RepID=UPI003609EB64